MRLEWLVIVGLTIRFLSSCEISPRFKFSILEGGKCVRREDRPPRKTMAFLSCLAKGSNFTIVTFVQWYFPRWFQTFFIFTPNLGEMIQFGEHIFQMGWFNHQLVSQLRDLLF